MTICDVYRLCCCAFLGALVNMSASCQSVACDNALDLCGQLDTTAVLSSPMDLDGFESLSEMFDANQVQVLHFHTTFFGQFAQPLEPIDLVIGDVACEDPVVAQVFQSNPLDVCNAQDFVSASELWTVNSDTTLTSQPLYQNTDYVVLLGSSGAACEVDVRLNGLAVSIDACCTVSIDYGESATVQVLGSDPELGYSWTPEDLVQMLDNQLAELSPYETTTFEVTGYVQGCAYADAVLVAVGSPIEVPNAFSPNNDSFNDTWNIYGLSQFPTSTIEVFDRWGQSVYRSVAYPNPWAGQNRGVNVPAGTYYYVIHLNEPNANLAPVTGYVAVIR